MAEVLQLAFIQDGEDGEGGVDGLVKVEAEVSGKFKIAFPGAKRFIAARFSTLRPPRPPSPAPPVLSFLLSGISSLVIIRNLRTAATWSKVVHDRG